MAVDVSKWLRELEWDEAYPENEHLAIKTIELLKKKWRIII